MLALLDVNAVIALFDVEHGFHAATRSWLTAWLADSPDHRWASCPLTQNAVVRILSQPSYPLAASTFNMVQRLAEATAHERHAFIPDDISIADSRHIAASHLLGPKVITDIYLLALAIKHDARFVTFDRGISLSAVIGATTAHLIVL